MLLILRNVMVISALLLAGLAQGQEVPWGLIPLRGYATISAFLQPASVSPGDVGLDSTCIDGAFLPMLRLGQPPNPNGPKAIRVEAVHSEEYLVYTSLWHYDPLTSRALPEGTELPSGFSMVMEWGGNLRLRVWFGASDEQPAIYSFGLEDFKTMRQQVPCLRASAEQSRSTWWAWDVNRQQLTSGIAEKAQAALYCPQSGPPLMLLRFTPDIDPDLTYLGVIIAYSGEVFDFHRVSQGVYLGDESASYRLLTYMVIREETIGIQLVGGPRPFLVLEPANIRLIYQQLRCIWPEDGQSGAG